MTDREEEVTPAGGEPTLRGRGGFRDIVTIPSGVSETRAAPPPNSPGTAVNLMANFVALEPMSDRSIHQYRVDFVPDIESVRLRSRIFRAAIEGVLPKDTTFDGMSDARSNRRAAEDLLEKVVAHPEGGNNPPFKVTIKHVGTVLWGSPEMLRVYNMNMKKFMRMLGFFQSPRPNGGFLHPALSDAVREDLRMVRGFKTSANQHMNNRLLMCLETANNLFQTRSVLNMMQQCRQMSGNLQDNIRELLVGKVVTVNYKRRDTYKIEDVNFSVHPTSTFHDDRAGTDITYIDYYKSRYNLDISDPGQPMLLVTASNRRRREEREVEASNEIYVVPEFCNYAGLTQNQQNDLRLRTDLIRSSQLAPQKRVDHMNQFLQKLRENREVQEALKAWGYSYAPNPIKIKGRLLPQECIGVGDGAHRPKETWPKVDNMGGFENVVTRDKLAKVPSVDSLAIIVTGSVMRDGQDGPILNKLREGFEKIGLRIEAKNVTKIPLNSDNSQTVTQCIRQLPPDITAAIVIIRNQNKELYDSIKKLATAERGLVTQVVTAKLMTDDRKARGAAVKIGIQLAAKIGGEPWYIDLPFDKVMVCGYDTHHDKVNNKSFGAFLASMNHRFSRWWSKADSHSAIEELTAHLATNVRQALQKYKELNNKYPERIFFYRDGVGDGQLEHVFNVELLETKKAIENLDKNIRFSVIIVNKRVGARFYMHAGPNQNPQFVNPPPGTIIDDYVTRKERFDFYLVSQSTRNGTVSPTYYNVIYDESGLPPARHQAMAFKFCSLYYNWTGTVKVPAPCQYAHKLAYLCGEHMHKEPNANLGDRLHFL